MTTMRAMMLQAYGQLEVIDMPVPTCGPHDLLVRVRACGICGSDIHGLDGSSGRRIPPLVMGHEAAGEVVQVGERVCGFAVGDRVTFDSTISCGECHWCRSGRINLCQNRQVLGVSCQEFRRHGAFAQYVVVPARISYRLPDQLPFEHAAMIEAVSIAVHAVHRSPIKLGCSAAVVGSGMIGLLAIQALKRAGCDPVIAIDIDPHRLAKAEQLGADLTVQAGELAPTTAAVAEATGGLGSDVTLEAVGNTAAIQTALAVTRRGGAVTLIGNLSPQIELPLQRVVTGELTLLGSCASNGQYPECIRLLSSGAIQVEPMITARTSLEETPGWFDRLYRGQPGAMKVIVEPWA
jgi:L-iditol 2-dehydrogenase